MNQSKRTSNAMEWWGKLPDSLNNGEDKKSHFDYYKNFFTTDAKDFSQLKPEEILKIWEHDTYHKMVTF